jgi:hypothetical protein
VHPEGIHLDGDGEIADQKVCPRGSKFTNSAKRRNTEVCLLCLVISPDSLYRLEALGAAVTGDPDLLALMN